MGKGWCFIAAKLIQQLLSAKLLPLFTIYSTFLIHPQCQIEAIWYKNFKTLYKKEILGFKKHVIKNMKNNRKFVKHGNSHLRVSSTFLLPKVLKIVC